MDVVKDLMMKRLYWISWLEETASQVLRWKKTMSQRSKCDDGNSNSRERGREYE